MKPTSKTVSEIIQSKYEIVIAPGRKGECPFCHKNTFSIKHDDLIGKCFHPNCSNFIVPSQFENEYEYSISRIIADLYVDFHRELLENKKSRAYKYLKDNRKIHDDVINDSFMGMIPAGYNLDSKFIAKNNDEKINKELKVYKNKLRRCIEGNAGSLAFFYTDSNNKFVSIRFRKPYTKEIRLFKPYKRAGIFGNLLFSELSKDKIGFDLTILNLIITEGEFNSLQMQSLMKRVTGYYINCCSTGGCQGADYETITRVSKKPVFCYDNDPSNAGMKLIESAREYMNFTAFTTPESDSDLDSYIVSSGENHAEALNQIKNLIANRKSYYRSYSGIAETISEIRKSPKMKAFEKSNEISLLILDDTKDRGRFYKDHSNTFYFSDEKKELILVRPDSEDFIHLISKYGMYDSEPIFKYVVSYLDHNTREIAQEAEIHKFAYWDKNKHILYVHQYPNKIIRITSSEIKVVDNGYDGIIFLNNERNEPFSLTLENFEYVGLFKEIIIDKINFDDAVLSIEKYRIIFELWFYSLFFLSIMPTRPIIVFVGEKGSGKSCTLKKILKLLFGSRSDVTPVHNDPNDFDACVTNNHLVCFDNADTSRPWLNDKLAIVATGGTISKRELYTTNSLCEIPVKCYLALTARTPQFTRDDVSDRLILMYVSGLKEKTSENRIIEEVISNRDKIWSEIVLNLQKVVKTLEDSDTTAEIKTGFRMADFAEFILTICPIITDREAIIEILSDLKNSQDDFTLENEPLLELLTYWLEIDGGKNNGRQLTSAELYSELKDISEKGKIHFPYKSTKSLSQKIKNLESNLSAFIRIVRTKGNSNIRYYAFYLKRNNEN